MTADPAHPPSGARLCLGVDGVLLGAVDRGLAGARTAPVDVA